MKYAVSALFVLFALSGLPVLSFGQATDGNLTGSLADQTGALIPDADVEVTNTATNVKQATKSNSAGLYRFNNLLAGTYDLKVSRSGFSTATLRGLSVALNTTTTANVSLSVGAVTQNIEVIEIPALIDTTTAQLGAIFGKREAIDTPAASLPLGVLNFSLLGAGVTSSGGLGLGDGPAVGGQRPRNNNFSVEGVDNNRKDVTGHNVDVPSEAVSEFSMLLNQYSAEFGNGTGGQFNTVLRGGGNEIHGAIFEYFQNRKLNALDQSFKRQGILSHPRYDQNTLGGSVGGPVIKDKLFYYGLYQYNPYGAEGSAASAIYAPTAAGYATLSSMSGISQTNFNILKQYLPAAASSDGTTTTVNNVRIPLGTIPVTKPTYTNVHTWLASVDYNMSATDRLRGRYLATNTGGFSDATLPALPAFFQGRATKQKLLTFSEFHNFSAAVLNEFRFGYNRYNDDIPSGDFQFPGLDLFPNIEIQQDLNLQLGPTPESPQSSVINTYQLIDNLSWAKGKHNLKFGWEGRKYIAPQVFVQRVRGDYDYGNLERFLLDQNPDILAERNVGGAVYSGNQINMSWYVSDEIRLKRNLTATVGVRYEYKGIPRDVKLQRLNAISSVPGLLEFREPKAQKDLFAPRIGLAYSPGSSGLTSIRAGFGMSYDKYFDNLGLLSTPPQISSTVDVDALPIINNFLKNGGIKPNTTAGAVCTTAAECRSITSSYVPDQLLPYSIQWNLGVQHVFHKNYIVEVRYVGTRGVHLFVQNRINVLSKVSPTVNLPTFLQTPSAATLAALPYQLGDITALDRIKAEYRPYFPANVVAFENRGNSNYHGLAAELTRRFSHGLLFKGAYTWSHTIDDSTADLFSTLLSPRRPQDFQNWRAEKGNSFLDRRHRFTFNWVYDTPWFSTSSNAIARNVLGNYTLSSTYTYESPQYATVQSGLDSNLNGDSAGDRAIVNLNGVKNTGSAVDPINRAGQVVAANSATTVAYVAKDPTARYIVAGAGALANSGRQTLPTRPINNWDVQVKKVFQLRERYRLEFAGQFFNFFNHPQFIPGYINNVQFHNSNTTRNNLIPGNAQFNRPDLVYDSNARTIQLVGRLQF